MSVYKTKITSIGELAPSFLSENMLILFGNQVPPELKNFCYEIEISPIQSPILKGMKLIIGTRQYMITSIGTEANQNLQNLGHVTLNFNGSEFAQLPGTIYLSQGEMPHISIGDIIIIE